MSVPGACFVDGFSIGASKLLDVREGVDIR